MSLGSQRTQASPPQALRRLPRFHLWSQKAEPSSPTRRTKIHARKWWHPRRAHAIWLGAIILVLVVIRLCLPYAVERYVNRQLNKAKDYGGSISDVDMQLYRGQYRIHDIKIVKRSGKESVPFFSATRLDLAIEWSELFHGAVVGKINIIQPRLNFISGPPQDETLSSTNESWDKMLESLFPFNLNRVVIDDGQIHYRSPYANPPVDVYLDHLTATATNLNNSRSLKQELPAGLIAKATTIGGGGLDLHLLMNPLADNPTYQITCELTNVDLTAMNDFLKAYGKFDVKRGSFALFTSVAAKDGKYEGYFKVFFGNLKVFSWEKEKEKDALEIFWQAIVGTLTTALKNQRTDQLATKVPISGAYNTKSVGTWTAVGTLLRNAFVHALVPQLDPPVTVDKIGKPEKEKSESPPQPQADPNLPAPSNRHGAQELTNP